jgi:glycosyltransferase involved in cell wall biosynthesis
MKFAFVSTMYGTKWGGSEELWSQTACRLKKEGHDVFVSVAYWLRESKRIAELANLGAQIETHSPHEPSRARQIHDRLLYGGPRVYERLKQFEPDLAIISQGGNGGGFDWAKVFRQMSLPYVIIVNCNSDHWWFGEQFGDAFDAYTASQRIFCVSHSNLDLLGVQLGEPLLNAEVVQNPFNVSTEPLRGWPDENAGWRFACVARLAAGAKGQDLLLQTLARPEWRDRPIELNLYGDGPDELALRRISAMMHIENVCFCGHVSDVRSIWASNHLLVLPSRFEGLPLALVEAMWCGRPAVVTDVGGNAELCIDGVTGFVARAALLSSFSQTLERAWDMRMNWEQMGRKARSRVESQISKDPVGVFSERLKACVQTKSQLEPVARTMIVNR